MVRVHRIESNGRGRKKSRGRLARTKSAGAKKPLRSGRVAGKGRKRNVAPRRSDGRQLLPKQGARLMNKPHAWRSKFGRLLSSANISTADAKSEWNKAANIER